MIGVMILSFVLLAVLSVPIAVALGLAVILSMVVFSPFPVLGMVQRMVTGIDSFVLLAIPFFMLTGRLMNEGGVTDRIFEFARCLVGSIRGGLAHANVVASMMFAGMSGSAVADAGGLGMVADLDKKLLEDLKAKGMQVTFPDREAFRKATGPAYDAFYGKFGDRGRKIIERIRGL
jgi:TRAP-type mannitol/chloroaromatic compound transport system permease large subunit